MLRGLLLVLFLQLPIYALEGHTEATLGPDTQELETEDPEKPMDATEAEEKGIIPEGAPILLSTGPVTPLSAYEDKPNYQAGVESMNRAEQLWKRGDHEAASDLALEAYDDLMEVSLPRIRKKSKNKLALQRQRDTIRAQRRKAASVYVHSSIDYIRGYVKKNGNTVEAKQEGKDRLWDLRDVAVNYPDLWKILVQAREDLK